MTAWNKKKRDTSAGAFAVFAVGDKFGVGLFHAATREPEQIRSVSLRSSEERLQPVVDRLNARSGITRDDVTKVMTAWRKAHGL